MKEKNDAKEGAGCGSRYIAYYCPVKMGSDSIFREKEQAGGKVPMKISYKIMVLCMLIASSNAYSFTECARPVKGVWINLTGTNINISFADGGSSITKDEAQLTDGQMARLLAVALTAQTTGKKLSVRYPEENMDCPPSAGTPRNDVLGLWIKDN